MAASVSSYTDTKQRTAFNLVCALTDTLSAMLATNALFHRDKNEYSDNATTHEILESHRKTFGNLRNAVWPLRDRLASLGPLLISADLDDTRDPVEIEHEVERIKRLRTVLQDCDSLSTAFMWCHAAHFQSLDGWMEGPELRDLWRKTAALRVVLAGIRRGCEEPLMWNPLLED